MLLNLVYWTGVILWVMRFTTGWIDRILAALVVGFTGIVLTLEFLSLLGAIRNPILAGICVTFVVSGVLAIRRSAISKPVWQLRRPADLDTPSPPRHLAFLAVFVAVWAGLDHLADGVVRPVPADSDAPIYHLPFAIQWAKAQRLTFVPTPFGEESASYFPANGELWMTWLIVTGIGPSLLKVAQWPFLAAGALGLYALGRQTGASREAAVFPAAVWTLLPLTLHQSVRANVDLIWTAFYFVALYYLFSYREQLNRGLRGRRELMLCSLAMGVVLGTKSVGLVFVPLIAVPLVWIVAVPSSRRSDLVILAAGMVLPCGYWYFRNLWWTGNPFYPLDISVFGQRLFAGWYTRTEMMATAYHVPVSAWPQLLVRLSIVMGPIFVAIWTVSVGYGLWQPGGKRPPESTRRTGRLLASLAVAHLLIYWFVIPYNTQERFLLPAMGMGLVPLSALFTARPQFACCGVLLLLVHVAGSAASVAFFAPTEGFPLLSSILDPASRFGLFLVLLILAMAGSAVFSTGRSQFFALSGMMLGLCIFYALSFRENVAEAFYPKTGFGKQMSAGWRLVEEVSPPEGLRIAYCGTNLPYYLFGTGLRNEVYYVAINDKPDWRPDDFHRAHRHANRPDRSVDPWPHWYRDEGNYRDWLDNLSNRGIDLLFISRVNTHGRIMRDPGGLPAFPIEKRWADAHPEHFVFIGPVPTETTIPWTWVYRLKQSASDLEATSK